VLIFANTREECHRLVERLTRNGHPARALTGDLDQRQRLKALAAFKDGSLQVLIATDVASRGLHIPEVSHVYNWDLPQDPEDYVHRIGRTARAGARGKAISLVDEASAFSLESVERFIGQRIRVEWAEDDQFVTEVRATSEERRQAAEAREARRARMPARDGHDRRPRLERRPAPPPARPRAVPPPPPAAPPAPAGDAAAGRPRRRRRGGRGRRPGGPSAPGAGPPSA
jgi:ATP-dependent RNA helicase RhlB